MLTNYTDYTSPKFYRMVLICWLYHIKQTIEKQIICIISAHFTEYFHIYWHVSLQLYFSYTYRLQNWHVNYFHSTIIKILQDIRDIVKLHTAFETLSYNDPSTVYERYIGVYS